MKKLILCLFVALQVGAVAAQDTQVIQKDFQTIIGYTKKMEIDKILDMTYPPMFKVMPKEQMSAMAKNTMSAMGIKTVYEEVPLNLKLSAEKKLNAATICLGKYNQSMILESSNAQMLDMMAKAKVQGSTIERLAKNKIRMKGINYLLAIKDANTGGGWKYLRYDDAESQINTKVLSKEILAGAQALKAGLK